MSVTSLCYTLERARSVDGMDDSYFLDMSIKVMIDSAVLNLLSFFTVADYAPDMEVYRAESSSSGPINPELLKQ